MTARTRLLADLKYEDVEAGSVARLRQVVTALPDAVAVNDEEISLTYRGFGLRTAVLRRQVADAVVGSPTERPVALLYDHTAPVLTGLWAILTLGRLMAAYAGILNGTTTAMYDIRSRGIASLPSWIDAHGVTVMTASPAILRNLVNSNPKPSLLAGLKQVTFAGEASYGPDIEAARALLPDTCVLRNRYGSSKTGYGTYYIVDHTHPPVVGALPAGMPMPDLKIEIVDESGALVAPGGSGTVTLTCRNLALEYLGTRWPARPSPRPPGAPTEPAPSAATTSARSTRTAPCACSAAATTA